MGQVSSHISGLFGDQSGKDQEVKSKSENHVSNKASQKKNNESNSCSYFPFGIMATPRNPLKRSRQISPTISVPQNILDIFSPPKKAKIEEEFLDFTFLDENETIEYYKKSKIFIILRGLPGSGKSTIAQHIKRKYLSSKICSADNFFMKNGEYVYDRSLIKDAHIQCQEDAIKSVQDQISVVVIDNTHLKRWEMKFYLDLAKTFNYIPVIVEAKTPWRRDVSLLVSKTVHNLDENILELKKNDFEDLLPSYFGWFMNEKDSFLFLDEKRMWIETVAQIPEFVKDFKLYTGSASLKDLLSYYKPSEQGNLHVTSNYIGRNLSPENKKYIEKCDPLVGKCFEIEVIGFVLTPRTFGARVKLSDEQLHIWAKDDNEKIPEEFWDVIQEEEEKEKNDCLQDSEEPENMLNGHKDDSVNLVKENGPEEQNGDNTSEKLDESLNNSDNHNSKESPKHNHTNGVEDEDFSLDNSLSILNKSPSRELKDTSNSRKENSLLEVNRLEKSWEVSSPKKQSGKINGHSPNKKSQKKQKGGVLIPENILTIDESVTKDTISLHPSNILDEEKFVPTSELGSRAHITLGCGPGVKASVTGLDMIFAIQKEVKVDEANLQLNGTSNEEGTPSVYHESILEGATIRNYGNGVWVIYLDETIKVKSVFSACY